MISDAKLPELKDYRKIEAKLPVQPDRQYSQLVVANGNEQAAVHRWFHFKEGFSAGLLSRVLESEVDGLSGVVTLLDPFCGVGTTLVSSQQISKAKLKIRAIGIERNPFIAFVARTKCLWPIIQAERLLACAQGLLEEQGSRQVAIPRLSSLTTGRCMSRYLCKRILAAGDRIKTLSNEPVRDALLLGLAASVEPLSNVRKDGRALRLVSRGRRFLSRTLMEKWRQIYTDCKSLQQASSNVPTPQVILGDGRLPTRMGVSPGSVDLVLTSPPYPNNIDYSEVYKLELWLLGFVTSATEFLRLRKSTFRSHPTSELPDRSPDFLREIESGELRLLLGPLLERTQSSPERWRHRLLLGYFCDAWISLKEQHRCLRRGGRAILVVGNSLHGGTDSPYLIPTDLAVAAMAKRLGFRIEAVKIARSLMRRVSGNHFLRESVIVLGK